jgi:outer membrane immunogenic protein
MLRIVSATTFAIVLAASFGARAADVSVYNWTGFYLGLNAGGNWGKSQSPMTIASNAAFASAFDTMGSKSFDTGGFTGGGQGGYNWQWHNILVGLETDFDYFGSAGSQSVSYPTPNSRRPLTSTITKSLNTDWLFTARPRVGITANNWLFYETAGLALTQLKASWAYADNFPEAANATASANVTGWTVGGGIEYAFPGNWLVGGEYLYVKFPGVSANSGATSRFPPVPTPGVSVSYNADLASNIIRLRLSKKF